MLTDSERQAAIDAVILASKLCQNVRSKLDQGASKEKEDRSPVTIADFGAQAVVLNALAKVSPDVPAVGEEDASDLRGDANAALRERVVSEVQALVPELTESTVLEAIDRGNHSGGASGRFWTLDPIDGTKGFLRNDQYAVALALIEDGEVTFGVLGCPHLPIDWKNPDAGRGCFMVAEKGKGCKQLDSEGKSLGKVQVDQVTDPTKASFCESVESGHTKHGWAAAVAEKLGITTESVRMDSQCKYTAIARGDASIYLRLPTRPGYEEKIWDHAAGVLCVTEAGGNVTDITGAALDFSIGRTLKDNRGVIATNGPIHDAVVTAVQAAQE
ncbi:3'(2'),5'-bisphosphate nucleotidase [Rubellicoccus peritrichatus]|uniref:3'(2'),5'-bisphosphate nucleotidase n=1 Tax=Rubellicoccus peritrichatus TaxID=3080537 RepID=A0AAQ3QS94_9BACT|nr:3'(2'),5'-bisphosphate nucleotidase [Puniceicoccus sp. CR14]WOO40126.1 3'(2'),5'-bisphosphate nucleotidase [Puniceicoccus sp. CR14]